MKFTRRRNDELVTLSRAPYKGNAAAVQKGGEAKLHSRLNGKMDTELRGKIGEETENVRRGKEKYPLTTYLIQES